MERNKNGKPFDEPCPYMDKYGNRGPENKPSNKRHKKACKYSIYYDGENKG